ncbi:MAG: cyanophycin synthetase, partial [Candidatus Omnitrophota bacterium]
AEVDESDGLFVSLKASHIIMPNLEQEHAEHYKNEKELLGAFKNFLKKQSKKSVFFYHKEDANLRILAENFSGKTISFGFSDKANVYAKNIKVGICKVQFDAFANDKKIGKFTLNIPGIHNLINALAVIALGINLGIDPSIMKKALSDYRSVKRRFEVAGYLNGAKVVEDYAHHPTEIKATIAAAFSLNPRRLITVFQPHSYTRTKMFYKEFSSSFGGSDEVILTDVYAANESKLKGVGTKNIYDIMKNTGIIPVKCMKKEKISGYLSQNVKRGDLVLILGAGDINKVAHEVVQK